MPGGMKDDTIYLLHIRECVDRIESYIKGGRQEFLKSLMVQDAVLRNLQVMAESCRHLSEQLKSNHPQIDWNGLSGFRNVLVHDYLGVDLERVWILVEKRLPELKALAVKGLL